MSFEKSKSIVIERPFEASFRDIKLTNLTDDSVVCRTTMNAISAGTDMKTYRGQQHPEKLQYPCVPGYENVGVVVHTGKSAPDGFKTGDRVMINECRKFGDICAAWGGGAGMVVKNKETAPAPFDGPARIPDNVSDKDAVLAYLACVPLKGIQRLHLDPSFTVLVTGSGMIGTSAMQILKIMCPGIRVLCLERHPFRRDIAKKFADHVLAPDGTELKKLQDITGGKKADIVIECSGNASVVGTLHQYIKDGGWDADDAPAHIHLQGDYPDPIIFDWWHRWFVKNCALTMTCALKRGNKETILKWISEGKFKTADLPVEIWPAAKCAEAYKYLEDKKEDVFKIIFDWRDL